MPALVTCPACGFKVQTAEIFLRRRVRCQSCEHRFIAAAEPTPLARSATVPSLPAHPGGADFPRSPPAPMDDATQRQLASFPEALQGTANLPLCPSCHRPVGWEVN